MASSPSFLEEKIRQDKFISVHTEQGDSDIVSFEDCNGKKHYFSREFINEKLKTEYFNEIEDGKRFSIKINLSTNSIKKFILLFFYSIELYEIDSSEIVSFICILEYFNCSKKSCSYLETLFLNIITKDNDIVEIEHLQNIPKILPDNYTWIVDYMYMSHLNLILNLQNNGFSKSEEDYSDKIPKKIYIKLMNILKNGVEPPNHIEDSHIFMSPYDTIIDFVVKIDDKYYDAKTDEEVKSTNFIPIIKNLKFINPRFERKYESSREEFWNFYKGIFQEKYLPEDIRIRKKID